jgi:hypothetical protein
MNLQQIREECWDLARDIGIVDSDRLWPTADINRIINRVYRQIARETKCIKDSETTSICLIPVAPVDYTTYTPGTMDYIWANDPNSWLYHQDVCPYLFDLDNRIIQIEEVKWVYRQWKLTKVSCTKWQTNPWWEQVKGMPTEYATDLTTNKIAINFRDNVSDYLRLVVRRLPLTDLIDNTDTPEFRDSYHDFFFNGVLFYMFSKQDADAINQAKAAEYREKFLLDIDEIKQQESVLETKLAPNNSINAFR